MPNATHAPVTVKAMLALPGRLPKPATAWMTTATARWTRATRLYTAATGWQAITRLDNNTSDCINVRTDANNGEAIAVWLHWNNGTGRFDVWSRLYSLELGWQPRNQIGAAGAARAYLWVRLKNDGSAVAIWSDAAGRIYTSHYQP